MRKPPIHKSRPSNYLNETLKKKIMQVMRKANSRPLVKDRYGSNIDSELTSNLNSNQGTSLNVGEGLNSMTIKRTTGKEYLVSPSQQKYHIKFLNSEEKWKQDDFYRKINKIFEFEPIQE